MKEEEEADHNFSSEASPFLQTFQKCEEPTHPGRNSYSVSEPFSSSFHRVNEERLMRLVGYTDKLVNEDKYHMGYEVLFSTHSSPMVPKKSPIKVSDDVNENTNT